MHVTRKSSFYAGFFRWCSKQFTVIIIQAKQKKYNCDVTIEFCERHDERWQHTVELIGTQNPVQHYSCETRSTGKAARIGRNNYCEPSFLMGLAKEKFSTDDTFSPAISMENKRYELWKNDYSTHCGKYTAVSGSEFPHGYFDKKCLDNGENAVSVS